MNSCDKREYDNKDKHITIRVNAFDLEMLNKLAEKYTNGSITKLFWLAIKILKGKR